MLVENFEGADHDARERFLREHAEELYADLTDDYATPLRLERAGLPRRRALPGLVPTRAEVEAEAEHLQGEKEGVEIAQGLLIAHVLASPRAGSHLVWAMLRPTDARARAPRRAAQPPARSTSAARTCAATASPGSSSCATRATSTPRTRPRSAATEAAVDLVLLDPEIEVGVFRGGVVDHPRYAGRRIFGAGHQPHAPLSRAVAFLFYLVRDLGYVNKLYRGLSAPEWQPGELRTAPRSCGSPPRETYAIGGACQLLHVMDHVIAERGCRLYLPARKEGIIPGASNLRLPRSVGDRDRAPGDPLRPRVRGRHARRRPAVRRGRRAGRDGRRDRAGASSALTSSGLVNAAANRRAMRVGQEPLDLFREYMAHVRARAGLLPLQPRAVAQPRAPLECPRSRRL